jgi:hypothetical protein
MLVPGVKYRESERYTAHLHERHRVGLAPHGVWAPLTVQSHQWHVARGTSTQVLRGGGGLVRLLEQHPRGVLQLLDAAAWGVGTSVSVKRGPLYADTLVGLNSSSVNPLAIKRLMNRPDTADQRCS